MGPFESRYVQQKFVPAESKLRVLLEPMRQLRAKAPIGSFSCCPPLRQFRVLQAHRPEEFPAALRTAKRCSLRGRSGECIPQWHFSAEEQAARIQRYFAHGSELGWYCEQQSS
jgi:hypothetical protein